MRRHQQHQHDSFQPLRRSQRIRAQSLHPLADALPPLLSLFQPFLLPGCLPSTLTFLQLGDEYDQPSC